MAYRDELEALRARLAAALAERDAARAEAVRLEAALLRRPASITRGHTPDLLPGPAARFRSIPGGAPIVITVVNESDRKIEALWLSYEGRERSAGTLVPGGRIRAQTYVGHCWRLVDASTGEVLSHTHVAPEGEGESVLVYREDTRER